MSRLWDLTPPAGNIRHDRPEREDEGRRERDFERFLTFIDAIVAIAVTLLVLPLVEIASDVAEVSTQTLLQQNAGQFRGFVFSFIVIVQLWFIQHNIVRTVLVQDRIVVVCLVVWAFTVVVLPIPTAMVSEVHEPGDLTPQFYVGTMAVGALSLAAAAWRVRAVPAIRDSRLPPDPIQSLVSLGIIVIALIFSLTYPDGGYLPLFGLILSGRITTLIKKGLIALTAHRAARSAGP